MARSSNAAETLPAVARRDSADLRTDLLRETLGNLFAQAAKSQEPQDGENSLGRLAERLAATIDNEALSQAWRRYQGGEKLGADTSFYSPAGRTVFEILERRVTQDAGFADQARRVVDAFEPQLKACRNEADPLAASLRLLLTEKGKVYVALAHVLGRLG